MPEIRNAEDAPLAGIPAEIQTERRKMLNSGLWNRWPERS